MKFWCKTVYARAERAYAWDKNILRPPSGIVWWRCGNNYGIELKKFIVSKFATRARRICIRIRRQLWSCKIVGKAYIFITSDRILAVNPGRRSLESRFAISPVRSSPMITIGQAYHLESWSASLKERSGNKRKKKNYRESYNRDTRKFFSYPSTRLCVCASCLD